jgi:hypothetical protein
MNEGYDLILKGATVVNHDGEGCVTAGLIAGIYDGVTVTGWPVGTFVRGVRVMWGGELTAPAVADVVRFLETLAS